MSYTHPAVAKWQVLCLDLEMRESQTRHLTHFETLTHQESTLYKATRRLKEPRYRHKNG